MPPLIDLQDRDMDPPASFAPFRNDRCPVRPFPQSHLAESQEGVRLSGLLEQSALRESHLLRRIDELEAKVRLREDHFFRHQGRILARRRAW